MIEEEEEQRVKFVERVATYPVVQSVCQGAKSVYKKTKDHNPYLKATLEKAENTTLFYVQPLITKMEQQPLLTRVDEFGCTQLDKIEGGLEKIKEIIESGVRNVKTSTTTFASTSKSLIEEKKNTISTYISDKETEKALQVKNFLQLFLAFMVVRLNFVHEQFENNPRLSFSKPYYEKVLQVLFFLSNHFDELNSILEKEKEKEKENEKEKDDKKVEKQEKEGEGEGLISMEGNQVPRPATAHKSNAFFDPLLLPDTFDQKFSLLNQT